MRGHDAENEPAVTNFLSEAANIPCFQLYRSTVSSTLK